MSFLLPARHAAALRAYYESPDLIAQVVSADARERVLDLSRALLGGRATLVLLGQTGEVDPATCAQIEERALPGGDRLVIPLRAPLLPGGEGPSQVFGALLCEAPARPSQASDLARHAQCLLLLDALREADTRDELTGLLNRDAFRRRVEADEPTLASGRAAALLLIDLDRLSETNAAQGRREGDRCLRTASAILSAQGIGGRWGGDELALWLPDLEGDPVELVGELGRGLRSATGLSVSIGAACAPRHGQAADELLQRADRALDEAKQRGGGKGVLWSEALLSSARPRPAGLLTGRDSVDLQHVDALLETVKAVSQLAPLETILTEVLDRCILFSGAERGMLLLRDDRQTWTVHSARRRGGRALDERPLEFATSIAEQALAEGRAVHKLSPESISSSASELGLKAVLCTPLQGEDIPSGAIYVDARSEVAQFDDPMLAFFEALTAEVGTALRNAVLHERLLQRANALEEDVAGRDKELARVHELWARDREFLRGTSQRYEELVGASPAMQKLFNLLTSVENSVVPVMIQGESGTGKELVARAIHARSPRGSAPFVAESCAAISESLFERELFGHCKGAFTGAHTAQPGLLEAADGGTLFLDEVGELPLAAQAKLLRCLQEGEVRRIGETKVREVDVRVVVATNRDLKVMVQEGTFREDLYFRLAVFRLVIPPLRDRPSDIPLLAQHLLEDLGERAGAKADGISPEALKELVRRSWPGNVRQLRNVLERAAVVAREGSIEAKHLEAEHTIGAEHGADLSGLFDVPLTEAKGAFLTAYARRLVAEEGSIAAAARRAGTSRQTFYRLLPEKAAD